MCGISGIITIKTQKLEENIFQSLSLLENRGYDSSGICFISDNHINIYRKVFQEKKKPIELLKKENYKETNIIFGHNRWATHGEKSEINAHPHISNSKEIVLVHNGIIENFSELKKFLIEKGFSFYSETDTEVIVNLLEYIKNENKKDSFDKIIQKTIQKIHGTFAFIIFNKNTPNKLYCCRRGSPLLIGYTEDYVMIVSEQSGFSSNMNTYIVLNNDDICSLEYTKEKVIMTLNQTYEEKILNKNDFITSPHPYPYWTLKEIHEQPQTILNALNHGGRIRDGVIRLGGIEPYRNYLENVDNIIFLGCGTSYHSGMIGRYLSKQYCNFKYVSVLDGADFDEKDIPKFGKTILVFISQSGETRDLYNGILIAKKLKLFTVGIINIVDSLIAREVDCGIYCNAEREVGVASTKAFTSQVICLSLFLGWYSQIHYQDKFILKNFLSDLQQLSSDFKNCIDSSYIKIKEYIPLFKSGNLFLLGKGCDEYISKEGSLKIKEISYIHSEAYSSSSLKHGPFALLNKDMPVILLHTNKQYESKILGCYEEVNSRLSPLLFITPFKHIKKPNIIYIPENKTFSFLLAIIPLQILAYELSLDRGHNPDLPRNLAKVVTVD